MFSSQQSSNSPNELHPTSTSAEDQPSQIGNLQFSSMPGPSYAIPTTLNTPNQQEFASNSTNILPNTSDESRRGFLEGFFVNCFNCHRNNQANNRCYQCQGYLCAQCLPLHPISHHIFRFNSLAERLSLSPNNSISSRVVGAGRRTESNSSTSSLNDNRLLTSSSSSISTLSPPLRNLLTYEESPLAYGMRHIVSPDRERTLLAQGMSQLFPSDREVSLPYQTMHQLVPPSQGEAILAQGDYLNTLLPPSDAEEMQPCNQHYLESRFYCQQCMTPVCHVCYRRRHENHPISCIDEGVKRASEVSAFLYEQIRAQMNKLRESIDILHRVSDSVDYNSQLAKNEVQYTAKRLISAIEAAEVEEINKIEQQKQVKVKLITSQIDNIRRQFSQLSAASERINEVFSNPIKNMEANYKANTELKLSKYFNNVRPVVSERIVYKAPTDANIQQIVLTAMDNLLIPDTPLENSMFLAQRPILELVKMNYLPPFEYPLPLAKSRPILGCKDIVFIKDFGKIPKMIWGKAGNLDGELCRPWGVTINRLRQFIVADRSNNRIQIFDCNGKHLFHFGTKGSNHGEFEKPSAVAVNPKDQLVVVDKDNHRIQVFTSTGGFLLTFGERGSKIGQFLYPWDVACDATGNILVSDARNHRIQLFHWDGVFITKWGGDELTMPRLIDTPRGVAFDPMGNILMTDFNLHRVVMINVSTGKMRFLGREGSERGQFNRPQGIICDDRGWFVVADSRNYRYQVFNEHGEFMWMMGRNGKKEPGEFDRPCDITLDSEGHIHLMDFGNDRIQVF